MQKNYDRRKGALKPCLCANLRALLRVGAYEFTEQNVVTALKRAKASGTDVKILYHARKDTTLAATKKTIAKFKLGQMMRPRLAKRRDAFAQQIHRS